MADDRRFPYSAEYASGRNCTTVKFAKRVLWVEMALRLWAVVGTGGVGGGDDARWRKIMSFTTEGEFVAEEDLTDEAQLTTACGADMAAARAYLAQAWQRKVDAGGADLSVANVVHVWDAAMKADKKGPHEYEAPGDDADGGEEVGPQATRRLKCSRNADGVVFVAADGTRKFVLTDGEPGPHAFAPYERMLGIESEHVKRGREAVKGAAKGTERVSGSKEWLQDLFAECGEGEQLRDIAERIAATVAPGLTLAQRAARASAPVGSDVVARQKALGWTAELGSGEAWGAAMEMRVLHIQAEADRASGSSLGTDGQSAFRPWGTVGRGMRKTRATANAQSARRLRSGRRGCRNGSETRRGAAIPDDCRGLLRCRLPMIGRVACRPDRGRQVSMRTQAT